MCGQTTLFIGELSEEKRRRIGFWVLSLKVSCHNMGNIFLFKDITTKFLLYFPCFWRFPSLVFRFWTSSNGKISILATSNSVFDQCFGRMYVWMYMFLFFSPHQENKNNSTPKLSAAEILDHDLKFSIGNCTQWVLKLSSWLSQASDFLVRTWHNCIKWKSS